ncbi:glyceraldehyde 3-phosphate dehydrogenase NAD-binding domain-containing protein [Streptomyces roseolus]|uniref:glyceraldehyde 3-phosphate dehydrogenase NAD-binding domain-containing protein n=1 Tax=Streptomyces roseolus TaxID=67358 RepID=UPI0037B635A7
MTIRIGSNGFGRIGRSYPRCSWNERRPPASPRLRWWPTTTSLRRPTYDSAYGRLGCTVEHDDESLTAGGHRIAVTSERDPADLPWEALGVDVVIGATGRFRTGQGASRHLRAGARRVLLSVHGKGVGGTLVSGVNECAYHPYAHHVISNAS